MRNQLNEFIDFIRAERGYSKHTVKNYQSDIEQYIEEMNIKSMSEITKSHIRAYLSRLANREMSASSRNRKLSSIRSLCKFLHEEGYIETNPSSEIKTAKTDRMLPVTFTTEEMSSVIDSAENDRDRTILEVLYGLGVRVDELVNIKVSDIDFNSSIIRVFGKGSKQRVLPMNKSSLMSIVSFLKKRSIPSQWLVPSPYNSEVPITDRTIRNIVYKYSKKQGLSNMSPHKFRHSCATHMHQNGMDIRDVQEMLGHSDISTTTIYTKVAINSLTKSYHLAHPRG